MPLVPANWNVVVLGAWNRAILTPNGIATRLFELPDGSPVEIEIAVDTIGPVRVGHAGLVVMVSSAHLIVELQENNFPTLERGMALAARAVEKLPETPFFAAGFNVRHRANLPEDELGRVRALAHGQLDERLPRAGFPPVRKSLQHVFKVGEGRATLFLDYDEDATNVNLNFEKSSSDKKELVAWLSKPIADVQRNVATIVQDVLGLRLEA